MARPMSETDPNLSASRRGQSMANSLAWDLPARRSRSCPESRPSAALLFAAALVVVARRLWHPRKRSTGQHSDLETGVDPSIRPGDDFFAYANGGWLKATEIPAGRDRWTARNEIDELDPPADREAARRRRRRAGGIDRAQGGRLPRRLSERGRHRGQGHRATQAAAGQHRSGSGQGGADAPAGQRAPAPMSTR